VEQQPEQQIAPGQGREAREELVDALEEGVEARVGEHCCKRTELRGADAEPVRDARVLEAVQTRSASSSRDARERGDADRERPGRAGGGDAGRRVLERDALRRVNLQAAASAR
jgi:hypothetical protein